MELFTEEWVNAVNAAWDAHPPQLPPTVSAIVNVQLEDGRAIHWDTTSGNPHVHLGAHPEPHLSITCTEELLVDVLYNQNWRRGLSMTLAKQATVQRYRTPVGLGRGAPADTLDHVIQTTDPRSPANRL